MKVRSTITLDADTAAAVERLQRQRGVGPSAAVNELIRKGLTDSGSVRPYVHETAHLGLRVDITNIGDVLDMLDEEP